MAAFLTLLSACEIEQNPPPPPPPPAPAPAPAPIARAAPSMPKEVEAEILHWFWQAGYKDYQSQAMAEHAWIESGDHPCVAGPHGLRYTYQWGGGRLAQLQSFAGGDNCPALDVQLAFADNELRNNPNFWCFWQATDYDSAVTALRRGFGQGRC
ncbi:MAG TPA: hypothetical protein VGG57_19650 [Stellaceae bacterium]